MPVDDVSVLARHAESIQDAVGGCFLVTQFKVVALLFMVRLFVGNEVSFEGRHL